MFVVCVATVAGVAPVFFLGALFPEMGDDLGYEEFASGAVVAVFFGASAFLSAPLGERIDRWGPFRSMRVALVVAGCSQLALAASASVWHLAVVGLWAGAANAGVQIASNVFIARRIHPARQGRAFAVKQSAMPAAALIAGGSLAAVAVNFGWRVVFVAGAGLSLVTAAGMSFVLDRTSMSAPVSPPAVAEGAAADDRSLLALALVSAAGASSVVALSGFFVDAATDAGVDVARAGVMLSVGGVCSIVARLVLGRWADRVVGAQFRAVAMLMGAGSIAFVAFAAGRPVLIWCALPVAFGAGWGWPGLFNLSVIRSHTDRPGHATGRTQTGTYIGATLGPFLVGYLAQSFGYGPAWWVAGGLMAFGAVVCWSQQGAAADRPGTSDGGAIVYGGRPR